MYMNTFDIIPSDRLKELHTKALEGDVLKNWICEYILHDKDLHYSDMLTKLSELKQFNINNIAKTNWQWVEDMGWHGDRRVLESIALIASEVGEAANECRGDTPSDKLGSELADIILRVGDLAYSLGIDIGKEITFKINKNLHKGNYKNRSI